MHLKKVIAEKLPRKWSIQVGKPNLLRFLTITFLGAFCHKSMFTFLKSAQNYNFFDTHEDLFLRKNLDPC